MKNEFRPVQQRIKVMPVMQVILAIPWQERASIFCQNRMAKKAYSVKAMTIS